MVYTTIDIQKVMNQVSQNSRVYRATEQAEDKQSSKRHGLLTAYRIDSVNEAVHMGESLAGLWLNLRMQAKNTATSRESVFSKIDAQEMIN